MRPIFNRRKPESESLIDARPIRLLRRRTDFSQMWLKFNYNWGRMSLPGKKPTGNRVLNLVLRITTSDNAMRRLKEIISALLQFVWGLLTHMNWSSFWQ
jgi:hypothetical protein